ncbi:MAG: cell envelope integrity protein TolA [Proteobacteria bacterium]|nr:cell envelope integrity protein TolA [Pseudomonadota bacterium]
MRNAFAYSVVFHASVLVIGYFGLPYIKTSPLLTDTPIMVEIVNVADVTNAPPPAPKQEKKPEPKVKKEPPPPPKELPKASTPPPPKEELAALPLEPAPEAKPAPKPKPKPEVKKAPKPNPVRALAKAKPPRKPNPPDAFASVLKTVEKLKDRPKEKEKEEKKEKKKPEDFVQNITKALSSKTSRNNPDRPLAISEIDLVRQQIRECWSLPAGAREAEDLSIEIRMVMNPDGTVRQAQILNQKRLGSDPFFRAAAESALRAVLNPRCNPLKLPPDKYQQWQNMILIFDPKQMF